MPQLRLLRSAEEGAAIMIDSAIMMLFFLINPFPYYSTWKKSSEINGRWWIRDKSKGKVIFV